MPKYLIKRFLWLLILIVTVLGLWRFSLGVDNLVVYFHQGADPASALHIVPNVPPDLYVGLKWQPDDRDTGRNLEPVTREDIQSVYLRAWLQWNISLLKQKPYGLETYMVGPALADTSSEINAASAHGWLIEQADMTHNLRLHFYSADGSIISFTDSDARVVNIIHDKAGNLIYTGEHVAGYQVVMFLEDGNWRIRQWVQISSNSLYDTARPVQTPAGFVGENNATATLNLNGHIYSIAGINYYPKDTPWDRFWPQYSPQIIEQDLSIIHALKLNTIRIFIPYNQFGGPSSLLSPTPQAGVTSSSTSPVAVPKLSIDKLADFLTRASKHNIHVIVTLFDAHADYSLLQWPAADRQLEALLTRFKNNPTILAWDIKNEPDLDYHASGQYLVDSWLVHVAGLAREYDPHHLLTIGWSTAQAAHTHIEGIDFVSFHYYSAAANFASTYASLQASFPTQPIVLEEFGLSTWNSWFFPGGHSEAEQAEYYATILHTWHATGSSGYLAWTLYDFNSVPSQVVGILPWQSAPQKDFGIIHTNGTFKSAAAVLTSGSATSLVLIPSWQHILKPFDITLFITGLLIIVGGIRVYISRRKRTFTR